MKIAIVSTLYPPYVVGGAEKAAATMAEALAHKGHEVIVISLHPASEELVETLNGVRVYRLPVDNWYWPFNRVERPHLWMRVAWHVRDMWNIKSAKRVGRILDMERPNVVNSHNIAGFSVAVWSTVRRRRIRLVHTLHDYYLLCSRYALFRDGTVCAKRCADCKLLTLNRKRSSTVPNAVISVSQYTLSAHTNRGYLKGVPTQVIYNIQETSSISLVGGSRRKADDITVFGFIGRIEQEKGIETLLRASKILTNDRWKLRVAGRGAEHYARTLRSQFDDSRIEWLGFVSSPEFYASVDVVVIPSLWSDPLPYVCVESLRAGKTLICSLSGGIPEIASLQPGAEFFKAGDVDALAAKMTAVMQLPYQLRADMSKDDSILDVFREDVVVNQYLKLYSES